LSTPQSRYFEPSLDPWEGIFARYLTVAGATVDLIGPDEDGNFHGQCRGCSTVIRSQDNTGLAETDELYVDPVKSARDQAQAHAEKCRALPRP
jgi:hypothetical protein